MKGSENENQNIFEHHINDYLLCQQSHYVVDIQKLPQKYLLDTQKSQTVDDRIQLTEVDKKCQKQLDSSAPLDQKSYHNSRIQSHRLRQMAQHQGNSYLIKNYYQQRNRNRQIYNQMRILSKQQVQITENQGKIEQQYKLLKGKEYSSLNFKKEC